MRPIPSQEIVLMFVGGPNMMLRPMDLWDEQRSASTVAASVMFQSCWLFIGSVSFF